MLEWTAAEIASLVHNEGVSPSEIVVLAPFLTDALRFALTHRLTQYKVPVRSHRPSRALRDEPATHTLLTLAALAHPQWGRAPTRYDVVYALMHAIADLDLVRAQLLADVLYRIQDKTPTLLSYDGVQSEMQQRITYVLGGRYEALRLWLTTYREGAPLEFDYFLARLFGEVLSQAGYGFHRDLDAAKVAATLVESVQKFRWIAGDLMSGKPLGQEYVEMVQSGVIAAQYVWRWQQPEDAVLLSPAYTFLLRNSRWTCNSGSTWAEAAGGNASTSRSRIPTSSAAAGRWANPGRTPTKSPRGRFRCIAWRSASSAAAARRFTSASANWANRATNSKARCSRPSSGCCGRRRNEDFTQRRKDAKEDEDQHSIQDRFPNNFYDERHSERCLRRISCLKHLCAFACNPPLRVARGARIRISRKGAKALRKMNVNPKFLV